MNHKSNWTIQARKPFFHFGIGLLFRNRHLIATLVGRDIKALYRQTLLGPLWHLIHPLLSTAVFSVIFGKIIRLPAGDVPYPVFFLTGFIMWNYFAECMNRTSTLFRDHLPLLSGLYLPRSVIPISICLAMLFRFAIQFLVLIIIICIYCPRASLPKVWQILLSLLVLIPVIFQALGGGLILAAVTCRYKDLSFLLSFALQLLMYITPVIYPLSAAPDNIRWVISLNPVATAIETFRSLLFQSEIFSWAALLQCLWLSTTLLLTGLILFNRAEKDFIDYI